MANNVTKLSTNHLSGRWLLLAIFVGAILIVIFHYSSIISSMLNGAHCSNRQKIMFWSIRPHPILVTVGNRETICTDGSGVVYYPLPKQLENADKVVFSPDGKRVAYVSLENTQAPPSYHIYVMNVDGSNVRQLANRTTNIARLAWSLDSRRLALDGRLDVRSGIYVVDFTCSNASVNCTSSPEFLGEGTDPSWSPDAEKIAFVVDNGPSRDNPNYDIYVMNADGSGRVDIIPGDSQDWAPAWSPDGQLIAFYSSSRNPSGIYVIKPNGSDLTFFTDGSNPAWSSDGQSIAFISERDNKGKVIQIFDWGAPAQALYVMSRDRTKTERLTFSDREHIKTFVWLPQGQ